jgi:hypothetical protein
MIDVVREIVHKSGPAVSKKMNRGRGVMFNSLGRKLVEESRPVGMEGSCTEEFCWTS